MSGYLLLKRPIVASASVAWAQLYQITSPSFLAAGTILLFHSASAAWNFAGDASGSDAAGAGARPCASSSPGATQTAMNSPSIPRQTGTRQRVIERLLRTAATAGRLAAR